MGRYAIRRRATRPSAPGVGDVLRAKGHGVEQRADRIEVDGASIFRLAWGDPKAPRIVFVHGGAASARWWVRMAPALARDHHVVAVDLSGHGESDWREEYRFATWADEVLACGPATVVGHSMGGFVAATAAARDPDGIEHLILVDTPLMRPASSSLDAAHATFSKVKSYPTRGAAIERFRPLPPQPVADTAFLAEVAAHSVRETSDGWLWKFDPAAFAGAGPPDWPDGLPSLLARVTCPVSVIVGEHSGVVAPAERDALRSLGNYHEVPDGHHHLMLDVPDALLRTVRFAVDFVTPD